MKKDIHPKYNTKAKVICACGNSFVTGSTMEEIKTELCSMCHPFYTGKQKLVDSARRVEKFQARVAKKDDTAKSRKGKKVKRAARAKVKEAEKAKKEITVKAEKTGKKKASTLRQSQGKKNQKKDKK